MRSPTYSLWGLTRHEFWLGLRSPAFWAAWGLCFFIAAASCTAPGTTASLAAYLITAPSLGSIPSFLLGLLALFWLSHVACRDAWIGAEELVLSKPQHVEVLVLGRFLGNFALVWVLLLGEILGAALLHRTWGGTSLVLSAYGHAFQRAFVPLLYLSALGYSLSLLFATPVAGGVVALYWLLVLSGRDYVARILNFSLTQNADIYLPWALGILGLALTLYQRSQRDPTRCRRVLGWATAVLFSGGLVIGVQQLRHSHDPPAHRDPLVLAQAGQHLRVGERAPGFWLPDERGRLVELRQFEGQVVVLALWSPSVRESLPVLDLLRDVHEAFRSEGVVCLAICVSEEHALARHFAREGRWPFPMLTDTGARLTRPISAGSPIAEAYTAEEVPFLAVVDRQRIVREAKSWTTSIDPLWLHSIIRACL